MADTEDSREKKRARDREYMRKWRAANPGSSTPFNRAWRTSNREQHNAQNRALYAKNRASNPMKVAYSVQKWNAGRRGIPWLFTFDQWWSVWQASGKWEQRGRRKGQYVMARYGDIGPYSSENTYICTNLENYLEQSAKRGPISAETRAKIIAAHLGKTRSAETCKRISEAAKARYADPEARKRMSEAKKRRHGTNSL